MSCAGTSAAAARVAFGALVRVARAQCRVPATAPIYERPDWGRKRQFDITLRDQSRCDATHLGAQSDTLSREAWFVTVGGMEFAPRRSRCSAPSLEVILRTIPMPILRRDGS